MECSNNPGTFGAGLINSKDDPRKVERTGFIGEMTFGALTKRPTFIGKKRGGGIDDFVFNNIKTDIKATRFKNAMLIKSVNEDGRPVNLKSDIYISGYLKENREMKYAAVLFIGYATGEYVRNKPNVKAIKGYHLNKQLNWNELLPIENLFTIYKLNHLSEILTTKEFSMEAS
jgi:hypothetical protein